MPEKSNGSDDRPLANWPRPVAFVLSGGGSYGAVQVGMLQALTEAGIAPDLVVGSSVGALNGVRYASSPGDAIEALSSLWREMGRVPVFGGRTRVGRSWSATRRFLRRNTPSLCSPEPLRTLIDANMPIPSLEDLPVPAAVVVTDLQAGRPKILTRGEVGPLLQATSAIPGVFPPVQIDGCIYVDGGVSANVPIRQAIAAGARSVIVLDANPATMPGTIPDSVMDSVFAASKIMLRNQRADADDELKGKFPILHLPQATPPEQSSFDFSHSEALIESGYETTRTFLSELPDLADSSRGLSEVARPAPDQDTEAAPEPESTDRPTVEL